MNATALFPPEFLRLFERANLLASMGNQEEAKQMYRRAAEACPAAWLGIGCETLKEGVKTDAMEYFMQVLEVTKDPRIRSVTMNNIGSILANRGNRPAAEVIFMSALGEDRNCFEAIANLALCYSWVNNFPAALALMDKAIRMQPTYHQAHFSKALFLLTLGRWLEGWQLYESRFKKVGVTTKIQVPQPEWDGRNIAGKTLLVVAEQGAGDTIHMARYGPLLRARGIRLIACVQRGLGRILEAMRCWHYVLEEGHEMNGVPFDYFIHFMSLPRLFQTTVESVPPAPYIPCPSPRAGRQGPLRVGFCWAGSVDHMRDIYRSTQIEQWKELFSIPGTEWHSFQVGHRSIDLAGSGANGTDYGSWISQNQLGFYETAQELCGMDLIISVDTSVVHLAGAMGIPTWVLLPFHPDWRWLLNREDSVWYPSLRLFRQPAEWDWASVFERVKTELEKHANS